MVWLVKAVRDREERKDPEASTWSEFALGVGGLDVVGGEVREKRSHKEYKMAKQKNMCSLGEKSNKSKVPKPNSLEAQAELLVCGLELTTADLTVFLPEEVTTGNCPEAQTENKQMSRTLHSF